MNTPNTTDPTFPNPSTPPAQPLTAPASPPISPLGPAVAPYQPLPPISLAPRPHRLLNPYVLILVGALLDSAGEVLLAKGSRAVAGSAVTDGFFGWLGPLASAWTWIGIISYVSSLLSWLYVLRFVPLSIAFPLINVVHVLVPAGAHIFLKETVPPRLWAGVGLIFVGVLVIARPLMKAEEKL